MTWNEFILAFQEEIVGRWEDIRVTEKILCEDWYPYFKADYRTRETLKTAAQKCSFIDGSRFKTVTLQNIVDNLPPKPKQETTVAPSVYVPLSSEKKTERQEAIRQMFAKALKSPDFGLPKKNTRKAANFDETPAKKCPYEKCKTIIRQDHLFRTCVKCGFRGCYSCFSVKQGDDKNYDFIDVCPKCSSSSQGQVSSPLTITPAPVLNNTGRPVNAECPPEPQAVCLTDEDIRQWNLEDGIAKGK